MSYGSPERIEVSVTLADQKLAKDAVAWVLSWDDGRKLSDYEWNLLVAVKQNNATYRSANILASAIPSYRRWQAKQAEMAALPPSNWVGEVGKRIILKLKVTRVFTHNSDFGCTFIYGFRDETANDFVCFGSNLLRDNDGKTYEAGADVTVKATVKAHGEYKGRRQTTLTRVALYTPPPPKVRKPRAKKSQAGEEPTAPAA
jgi:hypothetical protein